MNVDANPLVLGHAGDDPLELQLDRLLGSHACIIANSGGGKSGLLRKILEQSHGCVQHIVLDVEDEFYTLREKYEYVIAGGDGGDVPIALETAGALARGALEHGFSLIVQLNDLGADAPAYVTAFLDGLMSAPRALWHPVLVTIDELQRFASRDSGEATPAVRDLMFRGRKRGFTGLFASLRMAGIDPGIRGMVNNWMLGRVGQALDRKTMAEQLGFSASEGRANLASIAERHFWAMGPALAPEPRLFKVDPVETTPVHAGQAKLATPPAPDALRDILAGLAAAATAEPHPEDAIPADPSAAWAKGNEVGQALKERDDRIAELEGSLAEARRNASYWHRCCATNVARLRSVIELIGDPLDFQPVADGAGLLSKLPAASGTDRELSAVGSKDALGRQSVEPLRAERGRPGAGVTAGETATHSPTPTLSQTSAAADLPAQAEKMLAMLDRIAPARVTWASLAAMVQLKPRGGHFNAGRKALRDSGRVIEEGETIRSARPPAEGLTREAARQLWKEVLASPSPQMIDALHVRSMTKAELGDFLGIAARGGHFNNGVAQLVRNGVAMDVTGKLQLTDPLPGERP